MVSRADHYWVVTFPISYTRWEKCRSSQLFRAAVADFLGIAVQYLKNRSSQGSNLRLSG
jgi:hypothetical protein